MALQPKSPVGKKGYSGNRKGVNGANRPAPDPDYSSYFEAIEKVKAEKGVRKDHAAAIAHAAFLANEEAVYKAMCRGLVKGDPKYFTALANRAYGLPTQEMSFSQEKPFKLTIEIIGGKQPETIEAEVIRELPAGDKEV